MAVVLLAPASARGDAPAPSTPLRFRLGLGVGAWVVPAQGPIGEAVVGVDDGPFSLRVMPRFQYAFSSYPNPHFSMADVAIEFAWRPSPWYELSAAPLLGYTWASTLPPCYDVCYENPVTTGTTTGGTVSPVTVFFGTSRAFAFGFHLSLLDYPDTGSAQLGFNFDLRWYFLGFEE